LVIRCGFTGEEAYTPFVGMQPPPLPLRDAAFGLCTFTLTLLDCLEGLEVARRHRLFSWDAFDVAAYEHDEQLGNGDLNWIVPGLFVAFSGPLDAVKRLSDGRTTWHPRKYREYFRTNGVVAVVRLNKACYDKGTLTRAGIQHYDLFYPDGGLAPPEILGRFLRIAETSRGAVGVHCKAGLGRTGTCIGAYLMKHFRMTGREAIAWMRICRPGSVLGPQQQYLEKLQPQMWRLGSEAGLPAHAGTVPYPRPARSAPACAQRARPHHAIIVQSPPSTAASTAAASAAASAVASARAVGSFEAEGADAGPLIGFVAAQELLRAAVPTTHPAAAPATIVATEDGASGVSWSAAILAGAAAADAAMLVPGSQGSEAGSPSRSRDGSPHDPATPTGSDSAVHTPGHGRAMMPFAIRANRRLDGQQLGAPTPSAASTAPGVAVDSMNSPGGSKTLLPHLVPREDHGSSSPSAAAAAAASGAGSRE
jgi:cell division cycle 14